MKIPLKQAWKLLSPRITCLVTTVDKKGNINAACYSFIGSLSFNPPLVWVGFRKGLTRHTYDNIKETKEFVMNVVSEEFADEAIECSKISEKCNELEEVGLEWEPREKVKPPRVKKAKIVLECRYKEEFDVGGSHKIVIGEIVNAIAERVNENFNPDHTAMKTVYHYAGPDFSFLGKQFELDWGKKK